jgi:excisionase family DNA binding protein
MAHDAGVERMEATKVESPYLTYAEAARYCNLERTTIYRAMKAGRLEACGPGMAVRFTKEALDKWMTSRSRD